MQDTKSNMIARMDMDFLVHFSHATRLLRSKKYFTKQDFVDGLSRKLDSNQCHEVCKQYNKGIGVEDIVDHFLKSMNSNAMIIREFYVDYLFKEKIKDVMKDVVFFEFKLNGSRTDINRINGFSYAFEIKSGRDNPHRAAYQTTIFSDVFEYVTLIVSNEEEYKKISDNVGIVQYEYIDGQMIFDTMRKPKRNLELDSRKQLESLPKESLNNILNVRNDKIRSKNALMKQIINGYSEWEINTHFKSILKDRYLEKWKSYISFNLVNKLA